MTEPETVPLTYKERATFGTCPICHARPGEECTPVPPGEQWTGAVGERACHTERLNAAPTKKVVSYDVGGPE